MLRGTAIPRSAWIDRMALAGRRFVAGSDSWKTFLAELKQSLTRSNRLRLP